MIAIGAYRLSRRIAALVFLTLALALPGARIATAANSDDSDQRSFASPEEAVQALAAAVKDGANTELLAVLGPDAQPLISSGDPVADQKAGQRFLQSYETAHSLVKREDGSIMLQTGDDEWEFPIPLVQSAAGWHFDTAAGQEELLDRRIGSNELFTIQACLAYVDAQREYYDRNPDQTPLLSYAQKMASTPGKRDGLYWEAGPGEEESPLGPIFAHANAEGYELTSGKGEAFHGYYFRILTAQGPDAAGGAYDYIAHGEMIGGFGLVAYPATWDNSGVMTFIVNHAGVVYQKDLGLDTAEAAKAQTTFNPDDTWERVDTDDDEEADS
jgi:hypothetical protein